MPPMPEPSPTAQAADQFRSDFAAVRDQVARVVVGQTDTVDQILTCLFVGGHALLEGVPGIGKTLLVRTLAQAVRLDFGRVQFTPDLMPADITGTTVIDEQEDEHGRMRRAFRFQPGPVFNQILLADEINRATPKTQSALLEAMQERSVTVGGVTYKLEAPFLVLATQNPIEQEGTYPLPEAQLDRFLMKVNVGYAPLEDLMTILDRTTGAITPEAGVVVDAPTILAMQHLVRQVVVAPHVKQYAARLVLATHPDTDTAAGGPNGPTNRYIRCGGSPRAAQGLVLAGKVRALVDGRFHVSYQDIQDVALPVLRHRLLLNFEAEADRVDPDALVKEIIKMTPTQPMAMAGKN